MKWTATVTVTMSLRKKMGVTLYYDVPSVNPANPGQAESRKLLVGSQVGLRLN